MFSPAILRQLLLRCGAILLLISVAIGPVDAAPQTSPPKLGSRNTEIPFAYLAGGQRRWPVLIGTPSDSDRLQLELRRNDKVVASGSRIEHDGLTVEIDRRSRLSVTAPPKSNSRFNVHLVLSQGKASSQQSIRLQPAPPDRPISYISDLVDDLIRMFWDGGARRWRPVTRDVFDQYFRRLQCQGITRLIVWPGPFPTLADPANYPETDWRRFEACAREILDNQDLTRSFQQQPGLPPWRWLRFLMKLRLDPSIMRAYGESAVAHGIRLSVSFRPFESGLTKYYVVPRFDSDGRFLGEFLPLASPATMFHPEEVGFAGYAELLRRMGRSDEARPEAIEFQGVSDARQIAARFARGHRDLKLRASPFAPIDESSLVLVQDNGRQRLVLFEKFRSTAWKRLPELTGWRLEATSDDSLRISGLKWPDGLRFLWLEAATDHGRKISLPAIGPSAVRAAAGNRLGRLVQYWSLAGDDQAARNTRIVGIPFSGMYRTEFQAVEASHAALLKTGKTLVPLEQHRLVIDRGADWSVEMVDFEQPRARQEALAEIATQMAEPAWDEIFINTRSHTQLAASTGDGLRGISSILEYRRRGGFSRGDQPTGNHYTHLAIDRAAAPRGLAVHKPFLKRIGQTGTASSIESITTWQTREWFDVCPEDDGRFPWRFHRSRAIARGVRRLLVDLERRFPKARIRVVIPPGGRVETAVRRGLKTMKRPEGGVYTADFYRHIWGSNNHIASIGEGLGTVDLSGLRVEPTFLGIRFAPPNGPLNLFLKHALDDLAENRGSRFRGPHSLVYEAQETLRAPYKAKFTEKREAIIRGLLARKEIREVILYESADWTYFLPPDDPHKYLETKTKP